jgi:peptidyl-prolyl cis-trans isomerase SurA
MRYLFVASTTAVLVFLSAANGAVVDRMAVIVGKRVVKSSDIARDLRVTAFLNREPLEMNVEARRRAAERLIDQEIVRQEIATGRFNNATEDDALVLLKKIQQERFGGEETRLRAGLSQDGLTVEQLRAQLRWQLTVLRFIDQRFRPGVLVTDEEVRAYYDQHLPELRKSHSGAVDFETLMPEVRSLLESERIDKDFDAWIKQARTRTRIEYREEAFQ